MPPPAAPVPTEARAIYDYAARAPDELTFKRGAVIQVLGQDDEDDGWYRGVIDGATGFLRLAA